MRIRKEKPKHAFNAKEWMKWYFTGESKSFPWEFTLILYKHIQYWWDFRLILGGSDEHREARFYFGLLWFRFCISFMKFLPDRWAIGWYKRIKSINGMKFYDDKSINPRWQADAEGRSFGTYLFEDHLVVRWNSPMNHDRGFYWSCFPSNKILGYWKTKEFNKLSFKDIPCPLPEHTYYVYVRLFTRRVYRERTPFWFKDIDLAEVICMDPRGIVVPGKGENSWDQDDTFYKSSTVDAIGVDEAVRNFMKEINDRRRKYGNGSAMYVQKVKEKGLQGLYDSNFNSRAHGNDVSDNTSEAKRLIKEHSSQPAT